MTISENSKMRLAGLIVLFVFLCIGLYISFGSFMSNDYMKNEPVYVNNIIIYDDHGEVIFNLVKDNVDVNYVMLNEKIRFAEKNNYKIEYFIGNKAYPSLEKIVNISPIRGFYKVIHENDIMSLDFLICSIFRYPLTSNDALENVKDTISGGTGVVSWLLFIIAAANFVFALLKALIFGIETEISELGALVLFALLAYISYFIRIINDLAGYNQALQYFYILSLITIWVLVLICDLSIKAFKKENEEPTIYLEESNGKI